MIGFNRNDCSDSPKYAIRGIDFSIKGIGRDSILGDYFDAIVFACHMLLITNPPAFVRKVLNYNERIIRWTASLTFALYLFHRPLIQTIAAVYDGSHEDWSYRLAMILLPLIFIGLIGSAVESQKYIYKKYLNKLIKSS